MSFYGRLGRRVEDISLDDGMEGKNVILSEAQTTRIVLCKRMNDDKSTLFLLASGFENLKINFL